MTVMSIPEYPCRCGRVMSSVAVTANSPKPARPIICGFCLFVSTFTEDLSLRPATQKELEGFFSEPAFVRTMFDLQHRRQWRLIP